MDQIDLTNLPDSPIEISSSDDELEMEPIFPDDVPEEAEVPEVQQAVPEPTDSSRGCTRRSRSSGNATGCTRASGTDVQRM
jgi:hypothetical protein